MAINQPSNNAFQEMVSNYTRTDNFFWVPGENNEDSLLDTLKSYDVVLSGIFNTDLQPEKVRRNG